MKRLFLMLGAALFVLSAAAQTPAEGDVTLEMADGTTLRGFARTEMKNEVKFFELSAEPRGERVRYDSDQISRIVFDNGLEYVKQDYSPTAKMNRIKNAWMCVVYKSDGIALYSAYIQKMEAINMTTKQVRQTNYYIALGDGPAVWASTEWLSGGVINAAGSNCSLLRYLFGKTYQEYADLAERIKEKEFDTKGSPIEVVLAWKEAYGTIEQE
jgi:hypothetical protein